MEGASYQFRLFRRNGVQPFFLLYDAKGLDALEHLVRTGQYMGPLNQCMMAANAGPIGNNPIDWFEFLRRAPAGSKVAFQGSPGAVPSLTTLAIAFGIHIRVSGAGRPPAGQDIGSGMVQQIKRLARTARYLNRKLATCDDAKRIMGIRKWYESPEETLFMLGMFSTRQRNR